MCVTFVKGNKIYKSVYDYNQQSPYLFSRAYMPLQFLYLATKLNIIPTPNYTPKFLAIKKYHDQNSNPIIKVTASESFLLADYFRHGKIIGINYKPKYELIDWPAKNTITTDGRYYTYTINGKQYTIDIGFNFIDINNKN